MKLRRVIFAFIALGTVVSAQQLETVQRSDGASTALRIFAPPGSPCAPVAILSPGAGGTENGYRYLAQGLQTDGWLAVVVGHHESGPQRLRSGMRQSGLRDGLREMVSDPELYRDRLMDLDAATAYAKRRCQPPFIALLGHSMGAITVMLEAGARNNLGISGKDPYQAYVAISPSGSGSLFPHHAWSEIHKPVYILTGTRDHALDGSWQTRTEPFQDLPRGCKWLGIVDNATHMDFARSGASSAAGDLTVRTVAAFLDGVRRGSCALPVIPKGMVLQAE